MRRLCTIGEAARLLGVSIPTLRRWEESGKLVPERTAGKHRRYDITKLKPELAIEDTTRTTIAYARVSSHDQREDLERQKQVLELYCAQHGWNFTLLSDPDKVVAKAYGVWGEKKFMGRTFMGILRTTFVIDEKGMIERVLDKVRTKDHFEQIVEAYK